MNRVSFRIHANLFKTICHELCSVATVAEYNEKKKWLDEIANICLEILQWITWWDARKYYVFPSFRYFGYSDGTLAESGNSMLHAIMAIGSCV